MRSSRSRLQLVPPLPGGTVREKKVFRVLRRLLLPVVFFSLLFVGQAFCRVGEIRLSGVQRLESNAVIAACGVREGASLFLLNPEKVEQALRQLPGVETVAVKKIYPAAVAVAITERKPTACILDGGVYWVVDREGVSFEQWIYLEESLPLVTGVNSGGLAIGQKLAEPSKAANLETFLAALQLVPRLEWAELNITDESNQVLYTVDGMRVLLGDRENMDQKLRLLWQSMPYTSGDKGGGTYDLRTGDRLILLNEREDSAAGEVVP
ncbi:MAG: FtsQ-type POTRA domain-containing protein [Bacillota bacterium]